MMRAENILQVKEHLQVLIAHLERFNDFINCHMVNYLVNRHWATLIPKNIQAEIQNEGDIKMAISYFFNEEVEFPSKKFTAFQNFIETNRSMTMETLLPRVSLCTNELMTELEKLGCAPSLNEDLTIHEFCNAKKNHEIETISEVVAKLSSYQIEPDSDRMLVIDLGDGKGYLSSRLALQHKIKVLGVDGNSINTESAAKRNEKLGRAWNGLTRRANDIKKGRSPTKRKQRANNDSVIDTTTHAMNKLNIEEKLYKTTTLMIDSSTDLLSLVSKNFPENKTNQFALAGLHTCGNLSPNSLRIFLGNENLKVICNVGCCYHLLRERYVEDMFFNQSKLEENCQDYGFPMSKFLIEKKFALGRNGRMLASQAIYRVVANKEIPNESLAYRSLFEVILRQNLKGTAETRQVGKVKYENFEDYVHKCLAKLNMNSSDLLLPDLNELYRLSEYDCKLLQLFYFLRMSFAPVIETAIILDKYLYLLENGVDHTFIVKLFSPVVSPRCYGIIALK